MEARETLYKRNRLLVKVIWGMFILGLAVALLTGATPGSVVVLAVVGTFACGTATLLTYKRWLEEYVMYFIPTILLVMALLMIVNGPVITTYFLVYVTLAVMTLYSNFRSLLFTFVLGVGFTLYLFFSPYNTAVFGNNHPVTILLYLCLISAPLLASSWFSQRLQKEADEEREKALAERNRSLDLVEQISRSLGLLNRFSGTLKSNVTSTSQITQEVSAAFQEVTASIEAQTGSISDIDQSIRMIEEAVDTLAENSTELRALSESAVTLTTSGEQEAGELSEKMNRAREMMELSVGLMNQLNEQNKHIRDIIATIQQITYQTHLLALNAAIEAARAGEHGKGFAVVSHQIRNLAESSQRSTQQIEEILEMISDKIEQTSQQVLQGQQAILSSQAAAEGVSDAMQKLAANALTVKEQALQVESVADDVRNQYTLIAREMNNISRATEQNMAAVQQMAASMGTQYDRIKEITDSFLQLDKLANDLNQTAEARK